MWRDHAFHEIICFMLANIEPNTSEPRLLNGCVNELDILKGKYFQYYITKFF